jgi:hypothetical protein
MIEAAVRVHGMRGFLGIEPPLLKYSNMIKITDFGQSNGTLGGSNVSSVLQHASAPLKHNSTPLYVGTLTTNPLKQGYIRSPR